MIEASLRHAAGRQYQTPWPPAPPRAPCPDADNPLPNLLDPILLKPVVRPAISPYGHVMGAATWRQVLGSTHICPFTKQPLQWEQIKVLTKSNIHLYKDRIIR